MNDTAETNGVHRAAGPRVVRFPSYAASQLHGRGRTGRRGQSNWQPAGRRSGAWDGLSLLVAVGAVALLLSRDNVLATVVALGALLWVFFVRGFGFTRKLRGLWHGQPLGSSRWGSGPWGRLALIGLGLLLLCSDAARPLGGVLLAWAVVTHIGEQALRGRGRRWSGTAGAPGARKDNGYSQDFESGSVDPWEDDGRREAMQAGIDGEEAVMRTLAHYLPGGPTGYVIFQNLKVPGAGGDIDHLVVGPTGLFVLETKNVAGHIECDGDGNWSRTKRGRGGTTYDARMNDPVAQVRRNVRALRQYLEAHDPHLCARTHLWIAGMIVFPHPDAHLHVVDGAFPSLRLEHVVPAILGHRPRQPLSPADVDRLMGLLTASGAPADPESPSRAPGDSPGVPVSGVERGSAILETALVLPQLLVLALGVVGVGRVVQAQMGLRAVVREAARAAALANSVIDADPLGRAQASAVAAGYGLRREALRVDLDVEGFARGGAVRVTARYQVNLDDLPLLSWVSVPLSSTHDERIDRYRSRW
ncbi:MAG: NERD domain-containing protein [Chloroflexota bacterium]|nr:NERD domain-containing protein [Chloroflexota bacterium]